jgi:hypothetical protein
VTSGRLTRRRRPQACRLHGLLPTVLCFGKTVSHGLRPVCTPKIVLGGGQIPLLGGKHAKLEIRIIEPRSPNAARTQDPEAIRQQLDQAPDQK